MDKVKPTNAPNVSVHQRFNLLGDILTLAATPHTREQEQFRPNQPKGERKTKQKNKERFSRKPFLVFLSTLLPTFPVGEK